MSKKAFGLFLALLYAAAAGAAENPPARSETPTGLFAAIERPSGADPATPPGTSPSPAARSAPGEQWRLSVTSQRLFFHDGVARRWGVKEMDYVGLAVERAFDPRVGMGIGIGGARDGRGVNALGITYEDVAFYDLEVNVRLTSRPYHGFVFTGGLGYGLFWMEGRPTFPGGVRQPATVDIGNNASFFSGVWWRREPLLIGVEAKLELGRDWFSREHSHHRLGASLGLVF